MVWPTLIVVGILAVAITLYELLPAISDSGESWVLWVVGFFLLAYVGAAFYLNKHLPSLDRPTGAVLGEQTENGSEVIQVFDRISE